MFIFALVLLFVLAVVLPLATLKQSNDNGNVLSTLDTNHAQTVKYQLQIIDNQNIIIKQGLEQIAQANTIMANQKEICVVLHPLGCILP